MLKKYQAFKRQGNLGQYRKAKGMFNSRKVKTVTDRSSIILHVYFLDQKCVASPLSAKIITLLFPTCIYECAFLFQKKTEEVCVEVPAI